MGIHRFERTNGFNPDTAAFSDSSEVYVGKSTTWTDRDVKPNQFYTYVLDAMVDGKTIPRRWTEALTADDTQAPTTITGLRAEITGKGVLLEEDTSQKSASSNTDSAKGGISSVEEVD